MSEYSVMWSEKAEHLKDRLVNEKGVDRNYTKTIMASLREIADIQSKGYETFNDWIDAVLFDGKSAPYRVYSLHYFIVESDYSGQRVHVVLWAEDDEV